MYRYHHLFADLLHKRLRETRSADEIAALHRAASVWYDYRAIFPAQWSTPSKPVMINVSCYCWKHITILLFQQ